MFENDTSRQDAMQTNEKTSNRDEVMGYLQMKPDSNKPLNIRKNFLEILRHDSTFTEIRFNTIRGELERYDDKTGKRRPWTDAEDAAAKSYIEEVYKIENPSKYMDALNIYAQEVKYNPVQIEIEKTKWDGQRRAEEFLIKWAGAEDTPVNRECSRLLFAGGIRRAYEPGSKFDNIIVLIGSQGAGKSTLCRWLALDDEFYTSIKTISGQKGSEAIQGKWIIEVEELLAFLANDKSGSRMEENAKAYLSRQSEYYRKPYERRTTDTPRTCLFLGTTNRDEFLEDPTGNRRWYPVKCSMLGYDIFDREAECRAYIRQAWAEMLAAYRAGDPLANPYTSRELEAAVRAWQQTAEVHDELVGMIQDYLDREYPRPSDKVCIPELWANVVCMGNPYKRTITKQDSLRIGNILTNKLGWQKAGTARFEQPYGPQKAYQRPNSELVTG